MKYTTNDEWIMMYHNHDDKRPINVDLLIQLRYSHIPKCVMAPILKQVENYVINMIWTNLLKTN